MKLWLTLLMGIALSGCSAAITDARAITKEGYSVRNIDGHMSITLKRNFN